MNLNNIQNNMFMNTNINMNNFNFNINMITRNNYYFPLMIPFNPLYQVYINRNPISINDFVKIDSLGAGKHGSVGKYKNIYNNQIYAIKKMEQGVFTNPKNGNEKETDYLREILVLSDLNCKNNSKIIKLFAFFQDPNYRYLVIEYINGKNLKSLREDYLNKNEYIRQRLIISILKQLLEILMFLQSYFIIHRDIKPENIIIDNNNNIKLLDFGLAVYLQNPNPALVSRKSFKGSRLYVPPEILYSKYRNYDYKADIFSLGFTMYNLMNPQDINGNLNLPQITDENNQRVYQNNENKFYDDWLMNFIATFYLPDPTLRPNANWAYQFLLNNEHNQRRPNPDIALPNKDGLRINRSASTNINFNRDNFNINTDLNNNMIKKQLTGIINIAPEEFLQHNQGNENITSTSMKSLIQLLSMVQSMLYIKAQFQSVFNNNKEKKLFIKSYYDIFQDFELMKNNSAYKNKYDININNFISEIFQKNVSETSGPRPIILFFMMSSIINKEFNELCPKYKNYILDEILVMNNYPFNNILPYNLYKPLCDSIIETINNFKNCKRNPFVDYFCFLGMKIKKCAQCSTILDATIIQCQLLQLTIKKDVSIIDDLISNYFDEKYPQENIFCSKCHKTILITCKRLYCLNAPEYLILELEDKNKVLFKDNILLTLYDGKNINYKFVGAIYKKRVDNHDEFYSINKSGNDTILYDNDYFQIVNNDLINSDNPSMAIYQKQIG